MPVVAVCPVHGAFPSSGIVIRRSREVTFNGNGETCPHPGCGRMARIMDGTFSFDADGLATVVSAPQWSRQALAAIQHDLHQAALALRDTQNYSADRAYSVLEGRLAKIEAENGELGRAVAETVRDVKKRAPRWRLWQVVGAIAVAVQVLAALPDAIDAGAEYFGYLVDWAQSLWEQGQEPLPQNAPPPSEMVGR